MFESPTIKKANANLIKHTRTESSVSYQNDKMYCLNKALKIQHIYDIDIKCTYCYYLQTNYLYASY